MYAKHNRLCLFMIFCLLVGLFFTELCSYFMWWYRCTNWSSNHLLYKVQGQKSSHHQLDHCSAYRYPIHWSVSGCLPQLQYCWNQHTICQQVCTVHQKTSPLKGSLVWRCQKWILNSAKFSWVFNFINFANFQLFKKFFWQTFLTRHTVFTLWLWHQSKHCFADVGKPEWMIEWRCALDKPGLYAMPIVLYVCSMSYGEFTELFQWSLQKSVFMKI